MIVIKMRTGLRSELVDTFPYTSRDDVIEHLMYDCGFTVEESAEIESWAELAAFGETIEVAGYDFEIEEA